MDLSVIIPSFNKGMYIPDLCQSMRENIVFNGNMEIIVSDDASDEEGIMDLWRDGLSDHFPNTRFITSTQRMGGAANQNLLVSASRGVYVMVIDVDIKLANKWDMNKSLDLFGKLSNVAIFGGTNVTDTEPRKMIDQGVLLGPGLKILVGSGQPWNPANDAAIVTAVSGAGTIFKRSLFQFELFEERYMATGYYDLDMCVSATRHGFYSAIDRSRGYIHAYKQLTQEEKDKIAVDISGAAEHNLATWLQKWGWHWTQK